MQEACLKIIQAGLVESAHDLSDGGLAIALAECSFSSYRRKALGCEVGLEGDLSGAALLFSETPSRIVVSATDENVEQILEIARESGIRSAVIGRTGGENFVIKSNKETVINRPISEIESEWRNVLPQALEVASLVSAEEGLTS